MDIQARKLHLIEEFLQISDESLIKKIEVFIKKQKGKTSEDLDILKESEVQYQTTSLQRKKIEIAQEQIKSGQYFTQDQINAKNIEILTIWDSRQNGSPKL